MRTTRYGPALSGLAFGLMLVVVASSVTAQTTDAGKWEVEFHGGSMFPTNPSGGTVSLPAPGEAFTTAGIYPPPSPQVLVVASSRRVSSWYFGDGSLLFNQAATALAANPSAMTAAFPQRITALDAVLARSLGETQPGATIGVRASRTLTARLGVELSLDYAFAALQIPSSNTGAIDATSASFLASFNGLITSNPGRVLRSLTSTATLEPGNARQLSTSGTVILNLRTSGRLIPYAAAGVGLITTIGTMPSATLAGNYQFSNASGSQIDESDHVTVKDARDDQAVAGILGGGVKYHVSRRWGIRLDARISLSPNAARTTSDAIPSVVLGTLPAGRFALNSDPTLQFSNSAGPVTSLGVTGVAISSLSGPALTNLRTFEGTGVANHTNITAGMFWRF